MYLYNFPTVNFSFFDIYSLFKTLVLSWYNVSDLFMQGFNRTLPSYLTMAVEGIPVLEEVVPKVNDIIISLGFGNITLIGLLGGVAFPYLLVILLITIMLRWILDIGPL